MKVMRLNIPFPVIDLAVDNPIPQIVNAPEFAAAAAAVADTAASKRSLIPAAAAALIYALVRNAKPRHVVEIGTYDGGTSEIICRALYENGFGVLHTAGPFDAERVLPIFKTWPRELTRHLQFYAMTSMEFYYQLAARGIRPEIAFIDGDHSYEAALFDIQTLAKIIGRRGFLIIDNVSQAGPHYAAMDFLERNSDWTRCKAREPQWADPTKAFDRERTTVPETDFEILRAPRNYRVTSRPMTFGEFPSGTEVRGLQIDAASAGGTLHAQCVLRGFGASSVEEVAQGTIDIHAPGTIELLFPQPLAIKGSFLRCSTEPWLVWTGEAPLQLTAIPALIGEEVPRAMRWRSAARGLSRTHSSVTRYIVRPIRDRGPIRRLASRLLNRFWTTS
jgi:predicted O-methyltransferase YrrM